jgi:hypothetical protein
MTEQLADGYVLPRRWCLREVFRQRIFEADFPLFHQHHDVGCGKLLSHRPGLKHCFRLDRNLQLDVGEAVALGQDHLVILNNEQGNTGNFAFLHYALHVVVDLVRRLRKRSRTQQTYD